MCSLSSIIFALLFLFKEGEFAGIKRILNGPDAKLGEFPYQVSLQINGEHNCGGSILNKYYVLTAAHCIDGTEWRNYIVVVGTINLKNPMSIHNVSEAFVHENYDESSGWQNDIAILKVAIPFIFNHNIAPAKLARTGQLLKDHQKAIISGFGRIRKGGPMSTILLKTEVYIENLKKCQDFYTSDPVRSTNICVRNEGRSTGFCNGDSGGPLTVNGRVVGIVSFSLDKGCATDKRYPQVFARVSSYLGWIKGIISKR